MELRSAGPCSSSARVYATETLDTAAVLRILAEVGAQQKQLSMLGAISVDIADAYTTACLAELGIVHVYYDRAAKICPSQATC